MNRMFTLLVQLWPPFPPEGDQNRKKKKKNWFEKLQPLGYLKMSKSRLYHLSSFREKYDYFLYYSSVPNNRPTATAKKISDPLPALIRNSPSRLSVFYFFWEKPEKESHCYVRKILTEMGKHCFFFERRR